MRLEGCVAIITGSSSVTGIGAECAKALAGRGCNVVVNYVSNEDGARRTAEECAELGAETLVCRGDVSVDEDCRRMVAEAVEKWGRLDVLVNNAATTKPIPQRDLEALDAEEFLRIYKVNVVGTFQMTRAAAPRLRASGNAAVVNVSSIGAWRGNGSSMAYGASKGALNTLTVSLARVLAPEVRVNCVCPGGLLGSWTEKILSEEQYAARVNEANTKYPLRKAIWPVDVARTALWLIADADTMTGEAIRMDVGQHLM
jgi:3-oxoacyl-[acyl-carrier protein] reductase